MCSQKEPVELKLKSRGHKRGFDDEKVFWMSMNESVYKTTLSTKYADDNYY